MSRKWLVSLMAAGFAVFPLAGLAADAATPSSPDIDALIKQMEDSGKLDEAIDRGIQRYIQRQREAQQKQQEEQQRRQAEAAKNARAVDANRDRVFGNPKAAVSVIVYNDLECPFCKRFAGTPEAAIAKFDGKANLVFRHFPLDFHGEIAKRGAYYAECVGRQAGSDAFFRFTNDWFRLTKSNGQGLEGGDAQIREIAQSLGVKDVAALDACARDPAVARLVVDDIADGSRSGITGTPGMIVRNNATGESLAISGAVPVQVLENGIKKVLPN